VHLTEGHNLYYSRDDAEIEAEFVTSGHDVNFSRDEIVTGTWTSFTGQGQGDLGQDPLCAFEWPNVDLHLTASSPCINAGASAGAPPDDADGNPRSDPPDIGAYEYSGGNPCAGACSLYVAPGTTRVNEDVHFYASCLPGMTYDWDFGDGSAHSSEANPTHAYAATGVYTWTFTSPVQGYPCMADGYVTILPPVTPPAITGVTKAGNPFRLKLSGGNFQDGVQAFIGGDSAPWSTVIRKSETLIVLKSGAALKARFPKTQQVAIKIVNPDGGEATTSYTRP
jgi:hypothetical protein